MHQERRVVAIRVEQDAVLTEDNLAGNIDTIEEHRPTIGRSFENTAIDEIEPELVAARRTEDRALRHGRRRDIGHGDGHQTPAGNIDQTFQCLFVIPDSLVLVQSSRKLQPPDRDEKQLNP